MCWVCLCCRNPSNSDMDYRFFTVHTNSLVLASDCIQECTDTERESALKVDSGKKASLAAHHPSRYFSFDCSVYVSWVSWLPILIRSKAHSHYFIPVVALLFFLFFFSTSSIPCRKFGSPYLGNALAASRATLPTPNKVCFTFVCPNKGMAPNAWDP